MTGAHEHNLDADYVLRMAVARALRLIRAGKPNAARLALEVATYAAARIRRGAQ